MALNVKGLRMGANARNVRIIKNIGGIKMKCPYRKSYQKGQFQLGKGYIQDMEIYADCHGEDCPLYNIKLTPPCMRAVSERNRAYILIKEDESK